MRFYLSFNQYFSKLPVHQDGSRLQFLDGLRGIAIILVFLYHAYSDEWASFTPYGASFDYFFLFRYGEYGVPLFFLISGFVIAMTLEKCQSFRQFMFRRWLRLFPAMLIATFLILLVSVFINQRPSGPPSIYDTVPGLLFIQPEFLALLGYQHDMLETSFWSLFVEMKFYIVSGLLYFTLGLRRMIIVLVAMFCSFVVYQSVQSGLPDGLSQSLSLFFKYSDYQYYGWFAAGTLFYQYHTSKAPKYWFIAMVVGLVSARGLDGLLSGSMLFATCLVLLFSLSLNLTLLQRILSNRLLLFFGFISYPFYLIHVSSLISMIRQLNEVMPWLPHWMLPIIPIGGITLVAWGVASYLETPLRQWIKKPFGWAQSPFKEKSYSKD